MLIIRKNGNKNFVHQNVNFNDYGANDITIIFDGNYVKLRSISGRVIFARDGYLYSDVTVYDVSGSAEVFENINDLKQRLIDLGYPFQDSLTSEEYDLLNSISLKTDKGGYEGTS